MDNALATTIVSTGGAVIVGVFGLYFHSNQMGKRLDDLKADVKDLRTELNMFKDLVNSKFSALDLEIAKLMDKRQ